MDRTFVWGASATIHLWARAVHWPMDCMGESIEKQSRLLQEARKAGKEATEDILALLPTEERPYLTPVVPWEDILTPALTATRNHTEKAIEAINVQLSELVHRYVLPDQAGVFLASLLQVMCSYRQKMDAMATSQVILLDQIIPNLWGVSWCVMEGLILLGPPSCSASWPASLVEQVSVEPANKTVPVVPTTPAKHDTSGSNKGKLPLGSSSKKSGPPKQVTAYWDDLERDKEDAKSHWWEEEKHHKKKPSGPVLSLDEHKEPISLLTSKAIPSQVSQAPGLPTHTPSKSKRGWGKVQWASPVPLNSSDDEPLSDRGGEPEPKSRKKDHSTPELMIVDDDDDDPLPRKPKGTGKSHVYTQEELDGLDTLLLHLKSKAWTIQYSMETASLTKYCNDCVPSLRGAPNTDDHSTYLSKVKKESWSYPAKGNLITARQFIKELEGCRDTEKRRQADKTLREKGMLGIPLENTPKGGKWELIKARYMMKVLRSIEGEIIDAKHPEFGRHQNIGLYHIVSPASMKKVERSGQTTVQVKTISGRVDYGYYPLCPYASQNHRTLNNHVCLHF